MKKTFKHFICLFVAILCFGQVWGQTLIEADDMETTSGSGSDLTISGWSKGDCTISQSTEARTGTYSMKSIYNGTTDKTVKTTNTTISVAKNAYLHCIGYAKFESTDETATGDGNQAAANSYVGGAGKGTYINLSTTWTRFTSAKKASNDRSDCYVLLQRKHSVKNAGVLFDDVVIYTSTNSTTDITAPSAASSVSATASSISWTNGSDANTGIANTLIWRRTSGSSDDLTINDQGKYVVPAVGSTLDQSGHWTLVSATVGSEATSYSGTFSSGDRYAIVHRDLAYNYSTPTYVSISAGSVTPAHSVTVATSTGTTTYGTVSAASSTVAEGSTTIITATPAKGYQVASWSVTGTGASISPSGSSNNNTTTLTMGTADATVTVTFEEITCPTSGTLFSASVAATSDQSIDASASDLVLTAAQATVTGGLMSVYNGQSSAKTLIDDVNSTYYFTETNNDTYFKIELDCALQEGDVIQVDAIGGTREKNNTTYELGVWFSSASSRPGSAPAAAGTSSSTSLVDNMINYTVTSSDEYVGKSTFYIYRAYGATQYFGDVTITRPASETPVCPSGLSISGTTSYTEGETISLTAALEAGNGTITYTWYKGADLATAKAAGSIKTGASFSKASCVEGDAGNYWCEATKADCSPVSNALAYTVTVAAAKTVADLVAITDDWTFTPNATIAKGTMAESDKLFGAGADGDCDYDNGMRVKENRALAFKLNSGAKVKVTFTEKSDSGTPREMQLGTAASDDDNKAYGHSGSSPAVFDVNAAGVVYLTASSDLRFSKLEIMYPHTVTYALNDGTGTTPTQASKYVGETFTAHDGTTGITAPSGKEFEKWKDQDNADVAAGATYTMPAKNVTLTAQWRNSTTKYAVTYDLGDYTAGAAPTETNKAEGDVFAIKAAPEWTDHDFLGWKCNIDNNTYQATNNYTMTAAATTFTAQWQEYFTITYKDGSTTLDTEKVNAGSTPVGISDPTKELKKFEGWTLVGGSDLVNPASLTENTVLVAKWGDFDGCAHLAVDPEATAALSVGDNVALKTTSFGGSVKVAGMKTDKSSIAYNGYGLHLNGGGADSLRVTIDHQMQVGSKITVALYTSNTGTRGLNLMNKNCGAVDGGTMLGWTSATAGASEAFSYIVKADDGLEGEKMFHLQRNGSVYLKYITVEECAAQDYTVTYKDGETTLGTESVFENAHPTAAGISTYKIGYVFQGWTETAEGAIVELSNITITGAKTLYAKYTARDCSGVGTKFKFQLKTDLTSGNMFSYAPVPATAMTTENFLSALVGGEVEASNTSKSNNRIIINDQKAIGFANGNEGKLTLKLDCPLLEGDEIRFINYASSGNSITLSDGTNSTTLDGNKAETVQTFTVPEAWETTGAYELTMVRNEGTAKLTYFEIYRRPALTSVTLEDLNLKVGATGTPVMTLNPEGALVTGRAWAITASTATGTTIDENTGEITAGETAGQLTVQVTVNGDKVATCIVKVVPGYESVQPLSETTTWQWEGILAANKNIAEGDTVLANYYAGEQWEKIAGKQGEYAYRAESYNCYQGTYLYFKATVPGILTIYARKASDCSMSVNGNKVADLTSTYQTFYVAVPAGNVFITSTAGMRIKSMKFDTNLSAYTLEDNVLGGYERTLTTGNYGTICLPDGGVMSGASIFEIAYYDNAQSKIFFDEIINGQMVAGRPYIFLPNEGVNKIVVYSTDNANAEAGNYRGLYGHFDTNYAENAAEGRKVLEVGDYFLYNNQYYIVDALAENLVAVANYRAYIKLGEVEGYPTAPAPGRRRVAMSVNGRQVATELENVTDANAPRKVLMDGRMYIMLGEKMYDVTGQIAK